MKSKPNSRASRTNWRRLDKMADEEIDLAELPEVTPEMFARAIVRKGLKPVPRKQQLTLRVDSDVLAWFREQGKGYQTQTNAVLKAYKEAHERRRA
ncbi:MAG: BrnA antitoxin family protein [Dehalococcoidia bacterium]